MKKTINQLRKRRKQRTRAKLRGVAERPRLNVFRSHRHIYAQLIDDTAGRTLISASDKELKEKGKKTALATKVGLLLAQKAKQKGIATAIFDRGAYKYHGRVQALSEGFNEGFQKDGKSL